MKSKLPIVLILLLAFILRVYGVNWDQGFHLHPDERMLIMVTERLHFFDQLNPQFFNYGSLPIYLLKGVSQLLDFLFSTHFASYQGMLYVGRYLSIIFDIGTALFVYKISGLLFRNKKIQLFSSFLYAIAFFPIQNSHFFVVDVFLTFFTTFLVFLLLKYLLLPTRHGRGQVGSISLILIGVTFAAMLATKFTAVVFLPVISLILVLKQGNKNLGEKIRNLSIFYFLSSIFFFIFMPYAFIEYKKFIADTSAQIKMNSDPYIFPYTLQYVGTLPYLYYLKNIFLWGLGPVISILSLFGIFRIIPVILSGAKNLAKRKFVTLDPSVATLPQDDKKNFLYLIFYFLYFLFIGRSAVKFMRYMLPLYPFLTILAGYGLNYLMSFRGSEATEKSSEAFLRSPPNRRIAGFLAEFTPPFLAGLGMTLAVIWTSMFVNIYSQKHSRIAATEWILKNIPRGSTIALEHWDDGLPLTSGENYNHVELTLYDQPDDEKKWAILDEKLKTADYIIIASNRLYVPLQKLSDCKKYKSCYPKTAEYYRKLFNGELEFKKVAEFSVYPKISINNYQLTINDDSADESFTVYDHPKIIIFKRQS